jgi:hypothetical protein
VSRSTPHTRPTRAASGCRAYSLAAHTPDGHVWFGHEPLWQEASTLLGIPRHRRDSTYDHGVEQDSRHSSPVPDSMPAVVHLRVMNVSGCSRPWTLT